MDIRNHHNLLDSMEQFVKGDLLEGANAYHCEKCDKKVLYCSTGEDHLQRLCFLSTEVTWSKGWLPYVFLQALQNAVRSRQSVVLI